MDIDVHRRRAEALRERYPFASEVLTLYLALLDVWGAAADERPEPARLVNWAADWVLPRVVKATEAAGPEPLAAASRTLVEEGRLDQALAAWLAGAELAPVERYLARASLRPALELDAEACAADPATRDGGRCPRCGGPPQLSFRSHAEDPLVSGGRQLGCARCGHSWSFSASTCPSCGETAGAQRTVYAEQHDGPIVGQATPSDSTFPHLRIDACASCARYLIDVDMGRDTRAVPEVDELAALPLDLYAGEHGLSTVTPNLMGF
jgi:FdhE protein